MSDRWALVLAACAATGAWTSIGPPWPSALAVLVVLGAVAVRRPWAWAAAVLLVAGGLAQAAHHGRRAPAVGEGTVVLTLVSDPTPTTAGTGVRFDARLAGKRVEVTATGTAAGALADRLAGERVEVRGAVTPVADSPWRRSRHIAAGFRVAQVERWSRGDPLSTVANGLRRTLDGGAGSLPVERRSLLLGLVLGDDRGQSAATADSFRAAGLTHLLAVSGANVAFVLALGRPLLERLPLTARTGAALALIMVFAVVTRAEPSVLRASAMASVAAVAAASGRRSSGLRYLALAVTALVLVDPLLVGSVGFQLSVLASASILVLSPRLVAAVPGPRWFAEVVGTTLAAQVGVALLLVTVFGGIPVVSVPANVVAAPAAGPAMVWGVAGGLAAGVATNLGLGGLATAIHLPTGLLVGWIDAVADVAARIPLGELQLVHLGLLSGAVACWVGWRRGGPDRSGRGRGLSRRLAGAGAVGLACLGIVAPAAEVGSLPGRQVPRLVPAAGGVEVWRGGGGTVVLVGDDAHPSGALEAMRRTGVVGVDLVVVPNPDRTAVAVVQAIVERYRPELVVAPRSVTGLEGSVVAVMAADSLPRTWQVGDLAVQVTQRSGRLQVRLRRRVRLGGRRPDAGRARHRGHRSTVRAHALRSRRSLAPRGGGRRGRRGAPPRCPSLSGRSRRTPPIPGTRG